MIRSLLISSVTPKILVNAHLYESDYLIFNLEEKTAFEDEDSTRELMVQAVKHLDYKLEKIIIKVNSISSNYWKEDIIDLFNVGIKNFSISVKSEDELSELDNFIKELEKKNNTEEGIIKLLLFIGNPFLIVNIQNIIKNNRILSVAFDENRFKEYIKDSSLAKKMLVMGCVGQNIPCIDSAFEDLSNEDGFIKDIKDSIDTGFSGKLCFHPSQVGIINNLYSDKEGM